MSMMMSTLYICLDRSNTYVHLNRGPEILQQEIIIRMQPGSDRCHKRALTVAAAVSGVESIAVAGRDKDLLVVSGHGVDATKLTKKLKKEVGEAEIVELRTLAGGNGASYSKDTVFAAAQQYYSRSPVPAQWPLAEHRRAEAGCYDYYPGVLPS